MSNKWTKITAVTANQTRKHQSARCSSFITPTSLTTQDLSLREFLSDYLHLCRGSSPEWIIFRKRRNREPNLQSGVTTRMAWDDCSLLEPPEWTARVSEWHPGKYHLLQMFLAHSEQHLKYRVSIFYAQKTSVNTIAAIRRLKELGWGLQCLPSCQWVSPETPQNTLT